MKVKFFDAKNGDAIQLITDNQENIIIDMGYPETYANYIKKHIKEINEANLRVDLLIISHIDQDHIGGAISFLQDISRNGFNKNIIKEIWLNSYKHLSLSHVEKIGDQDYRILKQLKDKYEAENKRENNLVDDKKISAKQGSTLAGLIYKLNILWNASFDRTVISGVKEISINGLNIIILTPNKNILKRLKRAWRNELLKSKCDLQFGEDELFDDAFEYFLLNEDVIEDDTSQNISSDRKEKFQDLLKLGVNMDLTEDKSVTNASSISFIIEDSDKRILLTADATDNDLYNALKNLSDDGVSMEFDLIKLSHHGAEKNNSKWLSIVKAKYYVISTDSSRHNHPDLGSFVNIIINNMEGHKIICFNSSIEVIKELNNPVLMEKYNYSLLMPNQDWGIEIEL